jgi:hypothetical protein
VGYSYEIEKSGLLRIWELEQGSKGADFMVWSIGRRWKEAAGEMYGDNWARKEGGVAIQMVVLSVMYIWDGYLSILQWGVD